MAPVLGLAKVRLESPHLTLSTRVLRLPYQLFRLTVPFLLTLHVPTTRRSTLDITR
jgi:hypothetical protein